MRLFVGLYPPLALAQDLPRRTGREHLTLAFLSEVADPEPLRGALDAHAPLPAPRLRLCGAGRFRGGAVWLGVAGDLAALHRVHAAVQGAVTVAGLPVEDRPFRPHLTVGRGRLPPELAAYEGAAAPWRDLALMRSTLARSGAVHEPLGRWVLGDPAAAAGCT